MQKYERDHHSLYIPEQSKGHEVALWTSPDIAFLDTFTLAPGERRKMPVQFTSQSLPSGISIHSLHELKATPRSRYGQVFAEVEHIHEDLEEYFRENGITSLEGIDISSLQPKVTMVNYATRPNIIRSGGGAFRMYTIPTQNQVTGDALMHSFVRVDGKPISSDMVKRNSAGDPVALRLTLDAATRQWITPSHEPINIDPFSEHQRAQIEELLQPVPQTESIIPYLVYSKQQFTMPSDMFGIVASYGYADTNGKATLRSMSTHGTSQLLDPGRDWKIIFELRGQTTPETVANYIDIYLYKTGQPIQH